MIYKDTHHNIVYTHTDRTIYISRPPPHPKFASFLFKKNNTDKFPISMHCVYLCISAFPKFIFIFASHL